MSQNPEMSPRPVTNNESSDPDEEEEEDADPAEDINNPQYIPKKGVFYEHDIRDPLEDADEDESPVHLRYSEDFIMWKHDLFDEGQQCPKTDTEIKGAYGKDIRRMTLEQFEAFNEDQARRFAEHKKSARKGQTTLKDHLLNPHKSGDKNSSGAADSARSISLKIGLQDKPRGNNIKSYKKEQTKDTYDDDIQTNKPVLKKENYALLDKENDTKWKTDKKYEDFQAAAGDSQLPSFRMNYASSAVSDKSSGTFLDNSSAADINHPTVTAAARKDTVKNLQVCLTTSEKGVASRTVTSKKKEVTFSVPLTEHNGHGVQKFVNTPHMQGKLDKINEMKPTGANTVHSSRENVLDISNVSYKTVDKNSSWQKPKLTGQLLEQQTDQELLKINTNKTVFSGVFKNKENAAVLEAPQRQKTMGRGKFYRSSPGSAADRLQIKRDVGRSTIVETASTSNNENANSSQSSRMFWNSSLGNEDRDVMEMAKKLIFDKLPPTKKDPPTLHGRPFLMIKSSATKDSKPLKQHQQLLPSTNVSSSEVVHRPQQQQSSHRFSNQRKVPPIVSASGPSGTQHIEKPQHEEKTKTETKVPDISSLQLSDALQENKVEIAALKPPVAHVEQSKTADVTQGAAFQPVPQTHFVSQPTSLLYPSYGSWQTQQISMPAMQHTYQTAAQQLPHQMNQQHHQLTSPSNSLAGNRGSSLSQFGNINNLDTSATPQQSMFYDSGSYPHSSLSTISEPHPLSADLRYAQETGSTNCSLGMNHGDTPQYHVLPQQQHPQLACPMQWMNHVSCCSRGNPLMNQNVHAYQSMHVPIDFSSTSVNSQLSGYHL